MKRNGWIWLLLIINWVFKKIVFVKAYSHHEKRSSRRWFLWSPCQWVYPTLLLFIATVCFCHTDRRRLPWFLHRGTQLSPKIFPTFIFKPYVWSNQNTPGHLQDAGLHRLSHLHTHRVKSIGSSANRWSSGTERESWKQSKHFVSNIRPFRQQFPVDLLNRKTA